MKCNILILDGKLLSLEYIWSLIHYSFKPNLVGEKWNFITQQVRLNFFSFALVNIVKYYN